MDDIDYTEINGVEASARVVPIGDKECVECYELGDLHFEIWRKEWIFYLVLFVGDGAPCSYKYASAASARRAMYKMTWDFAAKHEAWPRLNYAVL